MPRALLVLVLAVAASAAGLSSTGCDRARELFVRKSVEKASGGSLSTTPDDLVLTGIDGGARGVFPLGGASATVPADFPAETPIYPGAHVAAVIRTHDDEKNLDHFVLQLMTADTPGQVVAFYKSKLKSDTEADLGGLSAYTWKQANGEVGSVTAMEQGGSTMVTLTASK